MYEPPDDVVIFISSYMNDNHGDALTQIAQAHGVESDVVTITGMTGAELLMRAETGGEHTDVAIAWPAPLQRREDIRIYL